MANSVLYYPSIVVPESEWACATLFYWDSIYSIIPTGIMENPEQLGAYMRSLLSEGLVVPIQPGDYHQEISKMTPSFIGAVRRLKERGVLGDTSAPMSFDIHTEKLSPHYDLFGQLEADGLAWRRSQNWVAVNEVVGHLYMAALSNVVAQRAGLLPLTDRLQPLLRLSQCKRARNSAALLEIRSAFLERLLPIPNRPVAPYEIVQFKDKHHDALHEFREAIELRIRDLLLIDDAKARTAAQGLAVKDLKERAAEIESKMKESRLGKTIKNTSIYTLAQSVSKVVTEEEFDFDFYQFIIQCSISVATHAFGQLLPRKDRNMGSMTYSALYSGRFQMAD